MKNSQAGIITLEILIALTIIVLSVSAVLIVAGGSQSISVDSQTNLEALAIAQSMAEDSRATASSDFGSIETTTPVTDDIYDKQTVVDPDTITQCSKDVTSLVTWTIGLITQTVQIDSHINDLATAQALGGNCDSDPPTEEWISPVTWASGNFNPGKPTSLDALNRIVYMGSDKAPFLEIADTSGVGLNGTVSFETYANNFEDDYQINDIKVAAIDGEVYAFVARDNATEQFEVINVTDINNPQPLATRSLSGVSGTEPEGWRLYYFDKKVFIVARFTIGPELHIFDVSIPSDPTEIGTGTELGRTVEDIVVTKKTVSGTVHYFLFLATKKDTAPLSIYDVTFPTSSSATVTELTDAEPTFTSGTYQDGYAVFASGSTLYFGRQSDPDSNDLFVYDISNPLSGSMVPLLDAANITQASVIAVAASGNFVFLATSKANKEFQVFTQNPMTFLSEYNFANLIENGLEYEDNWVYLASQGNDALRIIYSP
jgi:type II secretory pathway pseudopilin PulG